MVEYNSILGKGELNKKMNSLRLLGAKDIITSVEGKRVILTDDTMYIYSGKTEWGDRMTFRRIIVPLDIKNLVLEGAMYINTLKLQKSEGDIQVLNIVNNNYAFQMDKHIDIVDASNNIIFTPLRYSSYRNESLGFGIGKGRAMKDSKLRAVKVNIDVSPAQVMEGQYNGLICGDRTVPFFKDPFLYAIEGERYTVNLCYNNDLLAIGNDGKKLIIKQGTADYIKVMTVISGSFLKGCKYYDEGKRAIK